MKGFFPRESRKNFISCPSLLLAAGFGAWLRNVYSLLVLLSSRHQKMLDPQLCPEGSQCLQASRCILQLPEVRNCVASLSVYSCFFCRLPFLACWKSGLASLRNWQGPFSSEAGPSKRPGGGVRPPKYVSSFSLPRGTLGLCWLSQVVSITYAGSCVKRKSYVSCADSRLCAPSAVVCLLECCDRIVLC